MKREPLSIFRFPIFDKFALIEARSRALVKYFSEVYGSSAEAVTKDRLSRLHSLRWSVRAKRRGGKIAAKTFEFLGRQFDRAKVEEARLVRALLKRFGEDAPRLLAAASYEFGKKVGSGFPLDKNSLLEDREEIKKFLRFWFHDFVPCEVGFHPCFETCRRILVRHEDCPHRVHWEKAKVQPEVMCGLHSHFLKGFLEAVSAHKVEVETRRGDKKKDAFNESYEIL